MDVDESDKIIKAANFVQDKKLSNGNVCQICFLVLDVQKKQSVTGNSDPSQYIIKCEGPCKAHYHYECAAL